MASYYDFTPNSELLRIDKFTISCDVAKLLSGQLRDTYALLGRQVGCIKSQCFQSCHQTKECNVICYLEWKDTIALRQGVERVKKIIMQKEVGDYLPIVPFRTELTTSLNERSVQSCCLFKVLIVNRV